MAYRPRMGGAGAASTGSPRVGPISGFRAPGYRPPLGPPPPALDGLPDPSGMSAPGWSASTPGGTPYMAGVRPGQPSTPPAVNVSAETPTRLTEALDKQRDYTTSLQEGTGHALDVLGGRLRDAAQGGRRQLQATSLIKGQDPSLALSRYDAGTQGQIAGALAQEALGREEAVGRNLATSAQLASTPAELALQEKRFGLDAARLAQDQRARDLMAFQATLAAFRQSPLYGNYY